jgi:hypothetical protein
MSISAITSLTSLDPSLYASPATPASQTTAAAATTTGTAATALQKELADLIKALATGDLAKAKTLLAQIQQQLNTQNASTSSTDTTDTSSATNTGTTDTTAPTSLDTLLSAISGALNSGSTSDALSVLAAYLIDSGNSTGNLINTHA